MFIKILLLLFMLCYQSIQAMDTLSISPTNYSIDHHKHLIVINSPLSDINASGSTKTTLHLDDYYVLDTPVATFLLGQSYLTICNAQTYQLYFTELPLMKIYTTTPIVDEPSKLANLSLTESDGTHTSSMIGIEYRGASSQSWDKKSLRLEFWNDLAGLSTKEVQLLDMRSDDDWNLQAMANEPTRIRNKSNNAFWKAMSNRLYYQDKEPKAISGIELRYVELFLDEKYWGVYCLSERVDREQLQLKEPKSTCNRGQLYKGVNWGGFTTFDRLKNNYDNQSNYWQGFRQKYPQERNDWENLYNFCDFVLNSSDSVFYTDFSMRFDLDNAVDYFIFLNIIKAHDNVGKNLFLAQYDAGAPFFYVPWDLDGTTGVTWAGNWNLDYLGLLKNNMYNRLLHDCQPNGFKDLLRKRWRTLRQTVLSETHYMSYLQSNYDYLLRNGVYDREAIAWPSFNLDLAAMARTRNWIYDRFEELDYLFEENCIPLIDFDPNDVYSLKQPFTIYPTPAGDYIFIDYKDREKSFARIYTIDGKFVQEFEVKQGHHYYSTSHLHTGNYMLYIRSDEVQFAQRLTIQ